MGPSVGYNIRERDEHVDKFDFGKSDRYVSITTK
jgi:hypothetical protein